VRVRHNRKHDEEKSRERKHAQSQRETTAKREEEKMTNLALLVVVDTQDIASDVSVANIAQTKLRQW
jgi:hypothetical protein